MEKTDRIVMLLAAGVACYAVFGTKLFTNPSSEPEVKQDKPASRQVAKQRSGEGKSGNVFIDTRTVSDKQLEAMRSRCPTSTWEGPGVVALKSWTYYDQYNGTWRGERVRVSK